MSSPSTQLLAEIAFWREMLDADGPAHTEQAQQRMLQALALAEWKLLRLEQAFGESEPMDGDWADPVLASRQEH